MNLKSGLKRIIRRAEKIPFMNRLLHAAFVTRYRLRASAPVPQLQEVYRDHFNLIESVPPALRSLRRDVIALKSDLKQTNDLLERIAKRLEIARPDMADGTDMTSQSAHASAPKRI
jgi:hypothetical protein